MKRSVILTDRLGPDILLVLTMKCKTCLFIVNTSKISDEGLTLETSAFIISVRWPIYIINSVDKTKFLSKTGKHGLATVVIVPMT